MMTGTRKTRVLHVFGRMDRGGAETWIMNVFRKIDREQFHFDFLVGSDTPGAYDDEIRELGGRVIVGPLPQKPLSYAPQFLTALRNPEPYDVIHSHVHHYSGLTLSLARLAGIPVRIAHSHSDRRSKESKVGPERRLYNHLMRFAIRRNATIGLATSADAAASLFGDNWPADTRWRVLHCGIDLSSYTEAADRVRVRQELGLAPSDFVVGHVGRFAEPKNHTFIVDVFQELTRVQPAAMLLLIGSGPLENTIRDKVISLGLGEKVRFTGSQSNISRLLKGAVDCFVFPSLYEGLGLALIEAQAAGLPCVVSDTIPAEATVIPELVHRVALSESKSDWAETIRHMATIRVDSTEALDCLKKSSFNIAISARSLASIYKSHELGVSC